jgi:SAM-dependent methyltransferase
LPFQNASFDVVLSTFGVMFVPDQERAAAEMLRVVKRGGRIGLANWTPEGFIGQMFKVVGSFVPPPAGLRSPLEWGTEARLAHLFGREATDIRITRKLCPFCYRSAEHFVDFFRTYYGPTNRAFASLDEPRRIALNDALIDLLHRWNRSKGESMRLAGEYLEVAITK